MPKQIAFNDDARSKIKAGIDTLAEAVKMTLGPRGRAVVVEKSYGAPMVTFDGVTVAKEIELEDKYENLGAEFIKQAADKTNDNVGDGTTTSVVLAHAMIDTGEKIIREKGFNVIQLAEQLKQASQVVIAGLDAQAQPINENQKVREVATLSAKDAEIGGLIAEVMDKIGKDGVVTIDDSNTVSNTYEMVEGMQFDRGYVSHYMVTNQERMEAVLENVHVLVTDKKISSIQELLPVLEKLIQVGKKELVIVADDVDGDALATLIVNKLRGIFSVVAIKAPGFGDRKKELLQDLCIVTGAQLVSDDLGLKLENVAVDDLGQAARVIAAKDTTTFVGGKGKKEDIATRIQQLKGQVERVESEFEKEKLHERLGKLAGGVAVIKVGAPTESAQKELKQRVEDAVAATRAAMEEGIVPGGGMALFNVHTLHTPTASNDPVARAAAEIIEAALQAPLTGIVINSGHDAGLITADLTTQKKTLTGTDAAAAVWLGFNARTNEIGDLKAAGIIDPLKVTKTAFMNAVSVASNYLMIGAAVIDVPKKDDDKMGGGPGGMGMGGY